MIDNTYLFFQGGRCALPGTEVGGVADFDSHFSGTIISLDQLGLPTNTQQTRLRVVVLRGAAIQIGLVVRGQIEARSVADKDIIPLPPAFFEHSAFSALVRLGEQQFALLLVARSLISHGVLPSHQFINTRS